MVTDREWCAVEGEKSKLPAPRAAQAHGQCPVGGGLRMSTHKIHLPALALTLASCLATQLAAAELPAAGVRAADWPVFRGDALASGFVAGTLPQKLDVLWKFAAQKQGGFEATAVIEGGAVYVGSLDGNFYAIDLMSGQKKWAFHTELGFSAAAGVRDGRVYVGDTDGKFYCFDAADGKVLWGYEANAEIDSAPNFYKDLVLFGSQDATLYALEAKTGTLRWKYAIQDQIRCSPTVVEGRAFVAGCDGKLHVIDLEKGSESGSVGIESPTGATPAVRGDQLFFGTEAGTFFSIDWHEPKIVWTAKAERGQSFRSSAAVTAELAIVGARDKQVHAFRIVDGTQAWSFTTRSRVDSCPVVAGERVFVGSADGRLYGLNLKTGEKVWEYEAGGQFLASPAVASGRLVIGNQDGTLYCFGEK
jgi:outer membrane protein assembly factor BamB